MHYFEILKHWEQKSICKGTKVTYNIIAIIMGIDHFLDMFRTAINVLGDAVCTIIVSFRNNALDKDIFNGKKG